MKAEVTKEIKTQEQHILFGYVDVPTYGSLNTFWDGATLNNASRDFDLSEKRRSDEQKDW